MKTCACGSAGPFYRDAAKFDGLSTRCRECIKAARREYVSTRRDRIAANERGRRARNPMPGIWLMMVRRCHDPASASYYKYGARGIVVCERWRQSLNAFVEDVGPRPSPRHTLDRKDVNGNYEPGNVRWATPKEQARNTRRNRLIEVDGRTQTLAAWAEECGVARELIRDRIDRLGWSAKAAVCTPAGERRAA